MVDVAKFKGTIIIYLTKGPSANDDDVEEEGGRRKEEGRRRKMTAETITSTEFPPCAGHCPRLLVECYASKAVTTL